MSIFSRCFALTALVLSATTSMAVGRLIVNGDEWSFSDTAFAQNSAGTNRYVENVAARFGGSGSDFLFATSNSAFVGSSVTTKLSSLGIASTVSTALTLDAPTLASYDAVFLAGIFGSSAGELAALNTYIQGGGNVYIGGGTGAFGNAAAEAAAWNPLTTAYGITIGNEWIAPPAIAHVTVDAGTHFLRQGVDTLTYGFGHNLTVTAGAVIALSGGPELASPTGMVAESVPEPGTMIALAGGLMALARRRRSA